MKIKAKTIKRVVIIVASLLAVLAILFLAISLLTPKISFTEKRDDIFYFPVDYSEDIAEDLVYMNRFRDMKFDYYGSAIYVTEENHSQSSTEARFFYDYFQSVINGECETYKGFFDKSFFKRHSIPKRFTKQKIYDIEVSTLTSYIEDGVAFETYKVSYKIQENNGTFRADVSSNDSKPIAITIKKGREMKIVSIIPIL